VFLVQQLPPERTPEPFPVSAGVFVF